MKIKNSEENLEFREKKKKNFTGILEWCDGTKSNNWISVSRYKNWLFHSETSSAFEDIRGGKMWYLDGVCHEKGAWEIAVEKLRKSRKIISK
jgi:hypothetical protein